MPGATKTGSGFPGPAKPMTHTYMVTLFKCPDAQDGKEN